MPLPIKAIDYLKPLTGPLREARLCFSYKDSEVSLWESFRSIKPYPLHLPWLLRVFKVTTICLLDYCLSLSSLQANRYQIGYHSSERSFFITVAKAAHHSLCFPLFIAHGLKLYQYINLLMYLPCASLYNLVSSLKAGTLSFLFTAVYPAQRRIPGA